MNNKYLKIILFSVVILSISAPAQQLWDFYPSPGTYILLRGDTSSTSLHQILDTDSLKYEGIYFAAAHLLAYYEGESVKNFVLNKINHYSNTTDPLFTWNRFFTYQLLRGYLGDTGAIVGLDSVIQHSDDIKLKLDAISWLSEINELNYFDIVKDAFQNQGNSDKGISLLGRYGKDQLYTSEAREILSKVVSDSANHSKVFSAARSLAEFDLSLTIQLLENRFSSSVGNDQFNYFTNLDYFDPAGQPERSMYAIPLVSDKHIRSSYFPPTGSAEIGLVTRRYLDPFWINFIKEWSNVETETLIKTSIRWYLEDFKPFIIDSLAPTFDLLENLINITDTVHNYTWLADLQFKNELQSILQSAKTNLQAGDSVACAVNVKDFQDEVDFVYKDSLNADPRFVTIEGWKFLYWNAQYILDRLPTIPIVIAADIDVINPAMSLVNPGAFTMEVKGSGFSSSSVVYFNGNSRATTFVSDSTLNAQILSTDVSAAGNFPVWVSDNTLNSDTLIYKVVSTLPQPVRPVLECVTNNGDGTYTAFFGYKNENSVSVYIPVGSKNKFTPNPQDRGQTRVFKPGRQIKVYTVNFNGSNLVWTLNGRTSTASANSAPCQ